MKKDVNKKKDIFSIITFAGTIIANILVVALIVLSLQYSGLDIKTFAGIYGIIICLLLILDICFFVGYNYKDKIIKYVTAGLAVVLLVIGAVGSFYIFQLNASVSNIVDNTGVDQYEIIQGSIAVYNNDTIEDIKDLKGKKVGIVTSNAIGVTSVSKEKFEKENVEPIYVEYSSANELFLGLVKGEVVAACMQSSYRTMFAAEDGYEEYVEQMRDVYSFEERVKTGENQSANLDTSSEPFSVLLIGYAPEAGGGGLADTIILASVNPSTMTATMTSVARDTYTTISCTGGKAKINSARAQSRACLMETVGDLLDTQIDFYAEVNFLGLVDIIDALGGIYIDSPVEFVGQSPSSLRGEYTVWVPAGPYHANGEQALAFARERYAMPGGDYDRQIHQQEVIKEIAKSLVELRDVNAALAVMEAAGENFSTNLSIKQLTDVFNYIINAPNYTGISTFNLIDMQTMRVTGYSSWYYDYPMRLPQWIYKAYNGSIEQNIDRINDTMGEYDEIEQDPYFKFFIEYPYDTGKLYNTSFDEPMENEEMPDYYPYLTKMTYSEVLSWASARGIKLNVTSINEGESGYDASKVGAVLSQEPRYGALVEEWPEAWITVMGTPLKDEDRIPNFVDKNLSKVYDWAHDNGYDVKVNYKDNSDKSRAGKVASQNRTVGLDKRLYDSITVEVYDYPTVDTSSLVAGMSLDNLKSWINSNLLTTPKYNYVVDMSKDEGTLISFTSDSSKPRMDSEFTFTVTTKVHDHQWEEVAGSRVDSTETAEGKYDRKCTLCGTVETITIPMKAHEHSWVEVDGSRVEATVDAEGKYDRKCSVCGTVETITIPKLTPPDPTPEPEGESGSESTPETGGEDGGEGASE